MAVKYYNLVFIFLFLCSYLPPIEGTQSTKVKAIVFDFGGVITKTDRKQITEYISQSLQLSQEDAASALQGLKNNTLNDGVEIDYWQKFARSKGKKLPDDWLHQLNDVRFNSLQENPGMVELVKCLKKKGFQTALLSNVRKSQAQIKRKLGFYELFHPTLFSYETGVRKPDPKAFSLLLSKLNLSPQEVIFIDNKSENVAVAKSLGIDAILFENRNQLVEALKERGIEIQ